MRRARQDFAGVAGIRSLVSRSRTRRAGFSECEVFVGNDAGFSHLASGRGVKTLALYGMTSEVRGAPIGPAVALRPSLCPACHDEGLRGFECVRRIDYRCILRDIDADAVRRQVEDLFRVTRSSSISPWKVRIDSMGRPTREGGDRSESIPRVGPSIAGSAAPPSRADILHRARAAGDDRLRERSPAQRWAGRAPTSILCSSSGGCSMRGIRCWRSERTPASGCRIKCRTRGSTASRKCSRPPGLRATRGRLSGLPRLFVVDVLLSAQRRAVARRGRRIAGSSRFSSMS